MSIQSQSVRTTTSTSATPVYGIYPPATVRAALLEFSYIIFTTTTVTVGLGRPATNGTGSAPILFQQDDPRDPNSPINGYITWSVQPTAPSIYHRRWICANVVGLGVIWTIPRGIIVTGAAPILLYGITNPSIGDVTAILDA